MPRRPGSLASRRRSARTRFPYRLEKALVKVPAACVSPGIDVGPVPAVLAQDPPRHRPTYTWTRAAEKLIGRPDRPRIRRGAPMDPQSVGGRPNAAINGGAKGLSPAIWPASLRRPFG